ncbi:MAG: peptidoglycan bridge formation glycyltransferase FemA/FemB family protein [bacterium]|nr:peptidoglycan bridge formation glycyltransferase FemA/FemB family protein [bacterium]
MRFETLTEEEFRNFAKNHEQASFFQTVETAKLRSIYGSKIHFVGVKRREKIVAATMLTETITFLGKKTFYAPRGFLIDYHDLVLLKFFTEELKKYLKDKNPLQIKIDPNVLYQMRANDGSVMEQSEKDDLTIRNLKQVGFQHYGFNTDFIYTQSRWNVRLELNQGYEELKKRFSKSTRKNIDATYDKGVRIRKGTFADLESMEDILIKTAERKQFEARSLEYYKDMYQCLGSMMNIYIAYLDGDIYVNSTKALLDKEETHLKEILDKMKKDMVGNKLKNQKETSERLIEKLKKELEEAIAFQKENPKGKDIGVLISVESGLEYITLYSGILVEYKKFTPKYLMYDAHIRDAYTKSIPYVNFYGISGVFDPKDKDYGMFEFKRGFGGNVVELIGEFSCPMSFCYYLYIGLRNIKRKIRDFRSR